MFYVPGFIDAPKNSSFNLRNFRIFHQVDVVPFPLEHILLDEMLKDHGKVPVPVLLHGKKFTISLSNRNFSCGRVCKLG